MDLRSTSRCHFFRILALLITLGLAVTGCSGGGSSDNGEENAPSDEDQGDDEDSDLQSSALIYEDTEFVSGQERRVRLNMVNPDSPAQAPTEVEPLAQDNYEAAEGLDRPSTLELPRAGTLPLAVFEAELDGTTLSNARYESVVYNTADGELRRIPVEEDSGQTARLSNEDDASAVCAAEIVSDYIDADDSVLVYQVPKNGDCDDTSLRAVSVGSDTQTTPVTLIDTVSRTLPLEEGFTSGVYENGALTNVLAHDGSEIVALDLVDGSIESVEDSWSNFESLGFADEEQTAVYNVDGSLQTFDPATNSFESLSTSLSGSYGSVTVNDTLYIARLRYDPLAQGNVGEILRIDLSADDAVEVVNSDWNADFIDSIVATETHLAWAKSGSSITNRVVRSIELANPANSDLIVEDGDYEFVSWSDVAAENANASGWFLYLDNDEQTLEGVEISGESSTFGPIENAEWIGETWAPTASTTEVLGMSQPTHIIYTSDGDMKSREATDPIGETEVTFTTAPDELSYTSLGSYGVNTLMSQRQGQQNSNRPDIWYLSVDDAASLERITESPDSDSIPLPWF